MSGLAVCDASAVVALLLDGGPDGEWAARALAGAELAAPQLLPFEVADALRRHELTGPSVATRRRRRTPTCST